VPFIPLAAIERVGRRVAELVVAAVGSGVVVIYIQRGIDPG
jgi:hypothetical protein